MIRSIPVACALLLLAILAGGAGASAAEPVTLVGQVVCPHCWFETDHAAAARTSLAVRNADDGSFRLIELSEPPGAEAGWSSWIGKFVEVRGEIEDDGPVSTRSVKLLPRSPWPAGTPTMTLAEDHGHEHRRLREPAADKDPAPALAARFEPLVWSDPDGRSVTLEDYRGSVVVLNFWATWCAPCIREMPDLVKIQNRFAEDGVQVVAAAAESIDETAQVMGFAKEHRLNFPVLLGADADQMEALGLTRALPSTAILDRRGNVVERIAGVVQPRALRRVLRQVLAENPADNPAEQVAEQHQDDEDAAAHDHADDDGHDHGGPGEDAHGKPPKTDEASLVPS